MTTIQFLYNNLWREGTMLAASSEHAQYPMENSQDDCKQLMLRTRHGSSSGNGRFVIGNTNKYIDFAEVGSTVVSNGNMESWASPTNLDNWAETVAGTSTINQESVIIHGGTYSCRLDTDELGSSALIYESLTIVAGALYVISFWYRTDAGKTANFALRDSASNVYLTSDGTWSAISQLISLPSTSGVWTRHQLVFTSHASYTSYVFSLRNGSAASSSIYFDDVLLLPVLTATITPATYTAQTLVAEIKTRMDAAGDTYTPSYSESTGKFTLASASAFELLWKNGTNTANTAGTPLGFVVTSDDVDEITYTGDNVSIHTSEAVDCDFGTASEYNMVCLLNHNLTASAVITVYGADDDAFTSNVVTDVVTHNTLNIYFYLAAARTKRYCRIHVIDTANPSCYLQFGVIVIGKTITPNRNFGRYSEGEVDETEVEYTPSKNMFVTQEMAKQVNWSLPFKGLDAASKVLIRAMMANNGVSKALVFCTDTTAPNTNSAWVHFKELTQPEADTTDYWTWEAVLEEVL